MMREHSQISHLIHIQRNCNITNNVSWTEQGLLEAMACMLYSNLFKKYLSLVFTLVDVRVLDQVLINIGRAANRFAVGCNTLVSSYIVKEWIFGMPKARNTERHHE